MCCVCSAGGKSHYNSISHEEDGSTQSVEDEESSRATLELGKVTADKKPPKTWRDLEY